jgi:hypothetical protein
MDREHEAEVSSYRYRRLTGKMCLDVRHVLHSFQQEMLTSQFSEIYNVKVGPIDSPELFFTGVLTSYPPSDKLAGLSTCFSKNLCFPARCFWPSVYAKFPPSYTSQYVYAK